MKHTITLLAALMASIGIGAGAQTSQRITAGKATEYGLVYNLPKTALDIYIEAELTEEHPGEFHNYARRHLGATDAITADKLSARVKSVVISPRGIPDTDERWLAQFKAGSTPFMLLTDENIPLSINTDEIADIEQPKIPASVAATPSPLEGEAARQAVTQDMARSSSASKKAELAAQRIFELRETRSDILSGQADNPPADGKAMQIVLDNLSAQEAALTAMFTGVRTSRTVVEKVTFVPDSNEVSGKVIARLSAVDGILDADDLAGAPITLSVRIDETGTLPVNEKGETKSFPKGGVAYRIPGTATVSVSYAGREVASSTLPIAQLGVVFGLNTALFTDKKEPSKVLFDPNNGAVLLLGPAN